MEEEGKKKRKKKKKGEKKKKGCVWGVCVTQPPLNKRPVSAGCQNYTQLKQTNKTRYASLIWDGGYKGINLDPDTHKVQQNAVY